MALKLANQKPEISHNIKLARVRLLTSPSFHMRFLPVIFLFLADME
jgi:hypothetical protein